MIVESPEAARRAVGCCRSATSSRSCSSSPLGSLIDPRALGRGAGWLALLLVLLVVGQVRCRRGRSPGSRGCGPLAAARPSGSARSGEFSFVLASVALSAQLVSEELYASVLGLVVASIAASTILIRQIRPKADPLMAAAQ